MSEDTLDPQTILSRFLNGPAKLKSAVAHLTEAQLDVAHDSGTWTIRQIAHHIVDGDDLWKTCIKAALGNSEAMFDLQWYWGKPQDEWAERWNYAGRAFEPSLALFVANRLHVEQLVQQIPGAWNRSIWIKWPHREAEQVTVGDIIAMQAHHALGHVHEIIAIRQTHGF
jgi:DinB family protein